MKHPFDPIALIELGYAARADSLDWMRAMADPITRALDPGGRAPAIAYCLGPGGPEHVHAIPERGLTDVEALAELKVAHGNYSAQEERALAAARCVPGVTSARRVVGKAPESPFVRAGGYVDSPVVIVHPADRPPAVFATLSRRVFRFDAPQRALWRKLAAHLGAGCRLSGRPASADGADVECVMTPHGHVVHARGPGCSEEARGRIRTAVKALDRARSSRGRSDPPAALELWRGLLCGRWSLVDHFDSDGRRFLLARRNDPNVPGPALPLRQRQVLFYVAAGWSNKEVGYALGVGESSVAAHLRRALGALKIESRAQWIKLAACASAAMDEEPSASRDAPISDGATASRLSGS